MTETTIPYAKAYGVDNVRAQDALRHAAVVCLDQAIVDREPAETGLLPERYDHRYRDGTFIKDWQIALTIVGWKLAQPAQLRLTNVLEELACWAILTYADQVVSDLREEDFDFGVFSDSVFDDTDFLDLFDTDVSDGDLPGQLVFEEWLTSFGVELYGVPHPLQLDR